MTASSSEPAIPVSPEDRRIAGLAALAVTIYVIESALPSPIPGVKPGLANVITLVVLLRWGTVAAVWVSVLRVLAGSLVIGTFMNPTFLLSVSGATGALLALVVLKAIAGRSMSAIGYGTLSALAHMAAQFAVAYWLFLPHPALLRLMPLLLSMALVTGVAGGIIANMILERLRRPPE